MCLVSCSRGRADVDELRRVVRFEPPGGDLGAQALRRGGQFRTRLEAVQTILQVADDVDRSRCVRAASPTPARVPAPR